MISNSFIAGSLIDTLFCYTGFQKTIILAFSCKVGQNSFVAHLLLLYDLKGLFFATTVSKKHRLFQL